MVFANTGENALHMASSVGHLDVVKYLVEKGGCDPNMVDNDENSALHKSS